MPINPTPPPTTKQKAQAVARKAESWSYRHAPVIASFLAGVLLGSVLRVL